MSNERVKYFDVEFLVSNETCSEIFSSNLVLKNECNLSMHHFLALLLLLLLLLLLKEEKKRRINNRN